MSTDCQWLFPISALHATPSACSLDKELYDRARGVEFLFRLGSSLGLPTPAMFTAATWFHRFYMRYAMEDFHRQDVAASCIFLATKTEECGRKLRDVAKICSSKVTGVDPNTIPSDSKEVEQVQAAILLTEEILLEALCFDFAVNSPHADLVDLFDSCETDSLLQDYAWSIAHDSYRTPLCIVYPPKITATACYVLAQHIYDGPNSFSLDARISATSPSSSLPTPPSYKPLSPDASRYAIEYFSLNDVQLAAVSDALSILLEFYSAQDVQGTYPYLSAIIAVQPPTASSGRPKFYTHVSQFISAKNAPELPGPRNALDRTPNSSRGGQTPLKSPVHSKTSVP
ncbi:hypothetical protein AX17_003372 [Amanita inopinata Kibby_2008]|nr:hypothetical protein AX17_003372 [Amanita inopinata Kibby_2008]